MDTTELRAAISAFLPESEKAAADFINETALGVANRTFNALPPGLGDIAAKKKSVKAYLEQPRGEVRFKTVARRRKSGKWVRKQVKADALLLVHLLVNARRGKLGLKGLQGAAMKKASGRFKALAQTSVGFLKAVWVPVLARLNSACPLGARIPRPRGIALWSRPAGHGQAKAAQPGPSPAAYLEIGMELRHADETKAQTAESAALERSLAAETQNLAARLDAKMQPLADRYAGQPRL